MELLRFEKRVAVQKELLNALVNRTMLALLIEQQECLCALRFPRFSPSVLERLRKLATPQRAVAKGFSAPLQSDWEAVAKLVGSQQVLVCALLSVRLSVVHKERNRARSFSRQQQRLTLSRDASDGGVSGDGDYYSLEAKKNRKRRRLIGEHSGGDSYSHSSVSSYAGSSPRHSLGLGGDPHLPLGGATHQPIGQQPINQAALPLLQKLASMLQEVKQG